ncbi:hypothetical protein MLD38_023853 [Melastoma candidum]|uniref:Uncharacterized protein n=1 Tax=Melastoma candidum TaxID=119954 RepID=A0ACB9NQK1_9MYRT|nr:hypothetical protein MLD38_023853 [Melastoma candidum]
MGGRSRKKRSSSSSLPKALNPDDSSVRLELRPLIAALRSGEHLKASLLKSLYAYILQMSRLGFGSYSPYLYVSCRLDIVELSDMLFEELDRRLHRIWSAMSDISREVSCDSCGDVPGLGLLLRCCLTLLMLLGFDQELVTMKTKALLLILKRLISLDVSGQNSERPIKFKKHHERYSRKDGSETTAIDEDFVVYLHFLGPSVPCHSLITIVLEVFADELLSEQLLRLLFSSVEAASSITEKVFICSDNHQNVGILFEIISAHIFHAISEEQAFENFLGTIFVQERGEARSFELSWTATLGLLLSPIVISAPKIFQAHLNFLVAEAIDVDVTFQSKGSNDRRINNSITTFERSMDLYRRHMSSIQADESHFSHEDSVSYLQFLERSCPSFESFIKRGTKEKLDIMVVRTETFWSSYTSSMLFKSEAELLAGSLEYAKIGYESNSSYTDGSFSVLQCIIQQALPKDPGPCLCLNGEISFLDIYFLSSILKLMSSTLYHLVRCLKHQCLGDHASIFNDANLQRWQTFFLAKIRCFKQFGVNLPVQRFLFERLKDHPLKHEEYTWILLHFSGMLSLCFASGHDILIKGALSIVMTLVDLIIMNGDFDKLKPILYPGAEPLSFCLRKEVVTGNKSSHKVASTYMKVQRECFSPLGSEAGRELPPDTGSAHCDKASVRVEERVEETSSGEILVKCLLEGMEGQDDYDDLVDFIELKKGKDYCGWLRNREKFRKRVAKRTAVLKWKRKKLSKRTIKMNGNYCT